MSVNQLPLCRRDPRDPKAAARYEEQLAEVLADHEAELVRVLNRRFIYEEQRLKTVGPVQTTW